MAEIGVGNHGVVNENHEGEERARTIYREIARGCMRRRRDIDGCSWNGRHDAPPAKLHAGVLQPGTAFGKAKKFKIGNLRPVHRCGQHENSQMGADLPGAFRMTIFRA